MKVSISAGPIYCVHIVTGTAQSSAGIHKHTILCIWFWVEADYIFFKLFIFCQEKHIFIYLFTRSHKSQLTLIPMPRKCLGFLPSHQSKGVLISLQDLKLLVLKHSLISLVSLVCQLVNLHICPTQTHTSHTAREIYSFNLNHYKDFGKCHLHCRHCALVANPDFREVMTSYQHLAKDPDNI